MKLFVILVLLMGTVGCASISKKPAMNTTDAVYLLPLAPGQNVETRVVFQYRSVKPGAPNPALASMGDVVLQHSHLAMEAMIDGQQMSPQSFDVEDYRTRFEALVARWSLPYAHLLSLEKVEVVVIGSAEEVIPGEAPQAPKNDKPTTVLMAQAVAASLRELRP